ncbi:unnamed protein product [Medioppia subpectinata]|uniref:Homeobox domain-containing protein n=1 Tax=Medioppia subpectinata TaxID=1979941 RepID=A0A7R9PY18_9ACAR|nr:unnamed protein product [Medioppia subpectinata]CAG2104965.1 unnamed protein product [Medioppia subpectinata]
MLSSKSPDICCQPSFNGYRKPKRIRTAFSPGQLLRLEEIFERNRYVVGCERKQLARDLNLSETQIKVWFQNRRTKHKREKHQQNGSGKRSSTVSALIHGYSPNGLSLNGGQYSDNDVDDDDEEDFVH